MPYRRLVLTIAVRTGSDYGVTVSTINVSHLAEFLSSEVTVWGVPGDPCHDTPKGRDVEWTISRQAEAAVH